MIQAGAVVDGSYQLREQLGEGSAAQVWRAWDPGLDREVAIKFLTGQSLLADPARFREEARALAQVQHRHVLSVLAFGVHHGVPFLALEFASGGSLEDRLAGGELEEEEALALATDVLEGLQATHAAGILHRDLKPGNVLLTRAGRAKIADFGLAKRSASGVRTRSGLILGTPEYMAPEVLQGEKATALSDVFSWGCLAYALANGRPPFTGSVGEIARSHTGTLVPRGRERGKFARAIDEALALRPEGRASVDDLLAILHGSDSVVTPAGGSSSLPTVAASSADFTGEAPRRRKGTLGVAVVAAGVVGVVALLAAIRREVPIAPPPAPAGESGEGAAARARETARRRELVRRWSRRLGASKAEELLPGIHERVVDRTAPVALFMQPFPKMMYDARRGGTDAANLDALDASRGMLGDREDFLAARADLAAALGDREVPREHRLALWREVLALRRVDAYFAAWGRLPPFRAGEVLGRVVPVRSRDLGAVAEPTRDPGGGLTAPGGYRVFEWPPGPDRQHPQLIVEGRTGALFEGVGNQLFAEFEEDGVDLARHREVEVEVGLPEGAYRGWARARLVLQVARTVVPYSLRIAWDDWPVDYHAEDARSPTFQWMSNQEPGFLVEVELPAEFLAPGPHRLRVRLRGPPAVPRLGVVDLRWIGLVLE